MLSKHWLAGLALCAAMLPSTGHAAVTEDTFQLKTTSDLVDLCSAAPSDPMMTAAVNFCHGFAVGVFRVLDEENAAHRINKLFCIPNPTPSRNQALADFVQWAKSTPGMMDQRPADGLLAYLAKTYPCPRGK
jgi:hypothetical protein